MYPWLVDHDGDGDDGEDSTGDHDEDGGASAVSLFNFFPVYPWLVDYDGDGDDEGGGGGSAISSLYILGSYAL